MGIFGARAYCLVGLMGMAAILSYSILFKDGQDFEQHKKEIIVIDESSQLAEHSRARGQFRAKKDRLQL